MSLRLVVDPGVVQDYPGLALSLGVIGFETYNGPRTPYGHDIPAAGYFVIRQCNGDAPTFIDGPLTAEQVAAIPECASTVNERTIRQKAQQAFARRNAFLALSSPTNAQVLAEVRAQARDLNALARLLDGQFDSAGDV